MKKAYPSLSECYVGTHTVEVRVGLGWSWGNRVVEGMGTRDPGQPWTLGGGEVLASTLCLWSTLQGAGCGDAVGDRPPWASASSMPLVLLGAESSRCAWVLDTALIPSSRLP